MHSVLWEIILIAVLIVANGWFVMMEIAIVKARRARLQVMQRAGKKTAGTALELSRQPSKILSTLQIGVTLIGILTGALGGATITEKIQVWLHKFPILSEYSTPLAFALVVAVISFFSLLIGELIPKQVAFRHAEAIATAFASTMRALSIAAYPLVKFLSTISDSVLKWTGTSRDSSSEVTEEEVKMMVEHGVQTGVFEYEEREIFEGALDLADTRIAALMTPRTEIDWLDLNEDEETLLKRISDSSHKRFPVARGDLDKVIGIVETKEVYSNRQEGLPLDFTRLMYEPLYLPITVSALEALRQFKRARSHIALVVNEHGTLQGMLTTNDLVEAVLGELPTSDQPEEQSIIQREDGTWLVDGLIPIDEFKTHFGINELPMETKHTFHTLGGFIVSYMGRIPTAAERCEWDEWRIEVVDMDHHRVDKVLVTKIEKPNNNDE